MAQLNDAMAQLRDKAIETICTVLEVGVKTIPDFVRAFLVTISNTLYTVSQSQDQEIVYSNVVVTTGHIGSQLASVPDVSLSAFTLLQQRLCRPPSNLDNEIVDQMALIAVNSKAINTSEKVVSHGNTVFFSCLSRAKYLISSFE
eukprot:m.169718 g.169718  ORF g.169718 m.169718 type:complete len:145 (+) comp39016_c0_seq2:587-1021(+)